ncbi:MAG: ligase-associated DNA damage response endonuclease PdeM [Rhodobacteraceae bacterium]|nr:ligase-associated DNA damage response endonuclease PdeM [Paracoccaceae bacterium]
MSSFPFRFAGQDVAARPSGALWWPAERALVVADLHLGKAERMARRGGALLPPYEVQATLARLAAELEATGARRLIALGDSFDDDAAREGVAAALAAVTARVAVLWVSGNHDPGTAGAEVLLHGIALRHIAGDGPDISGHYHPKLRIAGRRVPVFLIGAGHLILPAFGTYTGGLDTDAPVLRTLIPEGLAVLTGRAARPIPLARRRRV